MNMKFKDIIRTPPLTQPDNCQSISVLFIGNGYSDDKVSKFYRNSKRGYQFAAQTLQSCLMDGLCENGVDLYVQSKPSLSAFPFGYRNFIVRGNDFVRNCRVIGHSIGFVNVPLLRNFYQWKKDVCEWHEKAKGKKVAIVYSLNMGEVKRALWVKEHYADVHIHVMIPDLPEYMGANRLYTLLGFKKKHIRFINDTIGYFDSYSMLTEHIANYFHIGDRPHVVIEGMFSPVSKDDEYVNAVKYEKEKGRIAFLYSGGLNGRYGIIDLVKAFAKTKNKDFELWLCGVGDSVDTIKKYAENDNRIKYYGALPHDKVLTLQRKAAFVVNPRHSNEAFINYSFPSKTMEYMASGTPTLMCHLGCLPKEYEQYLLFFNDESIDGMSGRLEQVATINRDELTLLGSDARKFILENKTPKRQVGRILCLIENSLLKEFSVSK